MSGVLVLFGVLDPSKNGEPVSAGSPRDTAPCEPNWRYAHDLIACSLIGAFACEASRLRVSLYASLVAQWHSSPFFVFVLGSLIK